MVITEWEDAEWECEEVAAEGAVVVGHGDGGAVSLPLLERHLIVQHPIL